TASLSHFDETLVRLLEVRVVRGVEPFIAVVALRIRDRLSEEVRGHARDQSHVAALARGRLRVRKTKRSRRLLARRLAEALFFDRRNDRCFRAERGIVRHRRRTEPRGRPEGQASSASRLILNLVVGTGRIY